MTVERRDELVRYWWSKAEECVASAQRELAAGSYGFAVNRLYYAVFYCASAALLERKQSFRKHTGVRAAFHRVFIKNGPLDVRRGKLYDQLFEDRQEGDYVAFISFDREYVESQLACCREFMDELRSHVSTLPQQ